MFDPEVLAQFLSETAFIYVPQIAGAVIAFSFFMLFLIQFRNKILGKLFNV
jgi:hypothetical protein